MAGTSIDWKCLEAFLKAPSKHFVEELFLDVFRYKSQPSLPDKICEKITSGLPVDNAVSAQSIFRTLRHIIEKSLYDQKGPSEIVALFPSGFHQQLSELFAAIITAHLPEWNKEACRNQPGLPTLTSIDWRVDLKSSSDSVSRMAEPTAIVSLKVRPQPDTTSGFPSEEMICFEIGKTTMKPMLEGLGKIRDQLGAIAKQ